MRKLALQEYFDAWKVPTMRNHVSCVLDHSGVSMKGTFDEAILAHCFFCWHALASSVPSKPPKPAKRKAKKKR